jgi:hypothetical protein
MQWQLQICCLIISGHQVSVFNPSELAYIFFTFCLDWQTRYHPLCEVTFNASNVVPVHLPKYHILWLLLHCWGSTSVQKPPLTPHMLLPSTLITTVWLSLIATFCIWHFQVFTLWVFPVLLVGLHNTSHCPSSCNSQLAGYFSFHTALYTLTPYVQGWGLLWAQNTSLTLWHQFVSSKTAWSNSWKNKSFSHTVAAMNNTMISPCL